MKKSKNNTGITLIALVITIIVLLILAGVTIATLTGENGLLNKASSATKKMSEQEAKEKIEMEISNLIIKKSEELKKATIDDLIEYVQENNDITIKKESEESAIIGTDGYAFRIDENLKIVETVSISLLSDTEMIYIVNSTNGNIMNITIMANVSSGIEKIITPDGNVITPNDTNKTKLAVDYEINLGEEYKFKLQTKGDAELKEYILIANENDKPIIEQNESYSYPIITEYGITVNKKVAIDYGEATEKYYSLDNGETWQEYTQEIDINRECTLMAKTQKEENIIQKIDKKEIKMNLASDALGAAAYDGDTSTYVDCGERGTRIIKVDSTMIGKSIVINKAGTAYSNYLDIDFYDNNNTKILSTRNTTITIPTGAVKIELGFYNARVYEIRICNEPAISNEKIYPTLTEYGVEQGYSNVTINYFNTSTQRLYKIDDGQWQSYQDKEIKLALGQTIYAKGIDKNEIETNITSYTSILPSDALGVNAYDGDTSTYVDCGERGTRIIKVDSTMIGKSIVINKAGTAYSNYLDIDFYDNNNTKILSTRNTTITIPTGAVKIELGFYNARIYEITVK